MWTHGHIAIVNVCQTYIYTYFDYTIPFPPVHATILTYTIRVVCEHTA